MNVVMMGVGALTLALGIVRIVVGILLFLFTLFPLGILDLVLGIGILVLCRRS